MELYTLFKIGHFLGIALGAGGAYVSDFMFFSAVRDKKISRTEMRFLTIGSRAVWLGLFLLVLSGIGLVLMNMESLFSSPKFWAKMSVVGIIIVNGIIFHRYHIPHLHKHVGLHFPSSSIFVRRIPLLLASGVVSGVSWTSALILGAMRGLPYSYVEIMSVYVGVLTLGIVFSILFRKKLIAHPR